MSRTPPSCGIANTTCGVRTDALRRLTLSQPQASVEYPVRKGRLEFILNQGDLRNQAVNVRLAMVNGAGVATVNGQQRGKYSRAFHGHGLNPEPTVERHQKRAPSPLKPKPVVVHINPRILNASAPAVLPQLPKSLDSNAVSSVYDFDFGPEVELLKEEGFAVRAASGDSARVPSPIPADSWGQRS